MSLKHTIAAAGVALVGAAVEAKAQNSLPGGGQNLPPVVTGPGGNGGCNGQPCGGGNPPVQPPVTPPARPPVYVQGGAGGNAAANANSAAVANAQGGVANAQGGNGYGGAGGAGGAGGQGGAGGNAQATNGGQYNSQTSVTNYKAAANGSVVYNNVAPCSHGASVSVGTVGVTAGVGGSTPSIPCHVVSNAAPAAIVAGIHARNGFATATGFAQIAEHDDGTRRAIERTTSARGCRADDTACFLRGHATAQFADVTVGRAHRPHRAAHHVARRAAAPAARPVCPTAGVAPICSR